MGATPQWPRTECTRPTMGAEPTPCAMPAKRASMRREMAQRSAAAWLMMLVCAPLSTNAFTACPFTCARAAGR